MKEIEIKAHVYDREKLIKQIETFAKYEQQVSRRDTYYRLNLDEKISGKDHISVRIRKENKKTENGIEYTNYITYKQKELKASSIEVNEEKESIIENPEVFESILSDTGYTVSLHKTKEVIDYSTDTEFGKANLEICNVQYLGDFLEIEILTETDDDTEISRIQEELKKLLSKCGINEKDVEKRYYSELLKEINKD